MPLQLILPSAVPRGKPLLVAYSGGADSRLLLHLAKAYGDTYGISVFAAHLHHGIRGEEADRDLAFCRRTAAELGITLFEKQVDVPALAQQSGKSLETEAREQRYAFFDELMRSHDIPILLTAHHADDQLETLLFRFLRGSGIHGMGGIPEIRELPHGMAVRPLLSFTKAEILAACAKQGLDYVIDSTNDQPVASRNRLRQEVIPLLESLVGEGIPQRAAGRLARAAKEDDDCLTALAQEAFHTCRDGEGLSLTILNTQPAAIVKRVLSLAYEQAVTQRNGTPPDARHTLNALHLDSLTAWCAKGTNGSRLDLPLITAEIRQDMLFFGLLEEAPISLPIPLYEGDTMWDNGRFLIRLNADPAPPTIPPHAALVSTACFPSDKLPLPLWARTRRAGDIIPNHGMHKKLKKLLIEKQIPQSLREHLPLIAYGEEMLPLWYPTVAFADGFLPSAQEPVWRISIMEFHFFRKERTYDDENLCIL